MSPSPREKSARKSYQLECAKAIVMGKRRLSARDALHVALMERERIEHVMSFDQGFDGLPGVTRLGA